MAELKTRPTGEAVLKFIDGIKDEVIRADCHTLVKLMSQAVKAPAKMWGPSIVGFGDYHYVYDSGREGDFFQMGFAPRKQNLTLYMMVGYEQHPDLMQRLGKYKTGKSCLYVKSLADVHLPTLKKLIQLGAKDMKQVVQKQQAKSASKKRRSKS